MTTQEELNQFHLSKISREVMSMLSSVDIRDNSTECWIECIDDNGEKIRLVPDLIGWRDRRKAVTVMNISSGVNTQLYFTPGLFPQLHDITLRDSAAYKVMSLIPAAVLRWAVMRAK